jgi:RNA polymerase sigma-70 factor (ECF subfamily)
MRLLAESCPFVEIDEAHALAVATRLRVARMNQNSDVQSTEPSTAGVSGSVGQLFSDYRRYVAKIGGGILRSHGEVDDLVQDVFLAMHRDLHKLRDVSCTKAWLATLTVRLAHGRLRAIVRQRRIVQIEPYALGVMSNIALPADLHVELSARADRVRKLPSALRTAWMLKHVDRESLPTIAERCECSESTAQRRIRSASRRLRA